ncbi:MAG: septum formation initiator family protein [Patescibacteria group bacterium]
MVSESGWKKFFGSRIFLLIAAIMAIMVIFAYARAYFQDYQVRQEIAQLQADAGNLEAKKIQLLEVLKYVKSSDFVEAKARSELNMIKPGEQVAVIPSQGRAGDNRQQKADMVSLSDVPNYIKWWNYFVH